MASEPMDRVVPLNQLSGYKVADGEPDIRGWDVVAGDGSRLGKVDDLLVDTQANKVRYVDVDVEGGDRHVTVPIGYARLEETRHQVLVDGLGSEQMQALPSYTRGAITRDYEEQVGRAFNVGTAAATSDFYEHDAFRSNDREMRLTLNEEQLSVGKRQVEAGEVGVHKTVETEHVHENVQVRHEEVEVERRPIRDPLAAGAGQITETEDEIRIPLMAEEVVVEKRVVPTEELVVRKREVVETEGVDTTLRRETAEVDREVTDTHLRGDRPDDDRLDRR
ncbi:MAG TPA: DUF2382 domain-containing protein [Longimicrobium sp.]|nr:DUF2382 domain-containing protein [Longimicrobium sp.]